MHATVVPHGQTGAQTESGSPRSPSPAARRRGAELRRARRRPHAPEPPWPPDIGWTAEIRTQAV